jgi:hypothetical protein
LGRDKAGTSRIISNRVYLGELHVGDLPPNLAAHPPLVSREVWEAAQIKHPRPPRSKGKPALLQGLVRCISCSRVMAATGSGYRCRVLHGTHRCPNPATISNKVEKLVEDAVVAKMRNEKAQGVASSDDLDAVKLELEHSEAELAAYTEVMEASNVPNEVLVAGLESRYKLVDDARRKLGVLQAAGGKSHVTDLFADYHTLTVKEKRHLLRSAIGAIWIRPGKRDFANRIKICDPIPTGVRQGRSTPVLSVDWDNLPVSVRIPSAKDL